MMMKLNRVLIQKNQHPRIFLLKLPPKLGQKNQRLAEEPEAENIPNFNEEIYAMTLEPSQDTELKEMESQQK